MKTKRIIKGLILAWAIPLVIIITVRIFSPDPNRPKDSFPSAVFTPTEVGMKEKQGSMGSDHFEFWLHNPKGDSYYHRDPESEPITKLYKSIPRDTPLKVIYSPTIEGNVLMEISYPDGKEKPILSFEEIMSDYSSRRRLVYIVAGIWFMLGNLILYSIWKSDDKESSMET